MALEVCNKIESKRIKTHEKEQLILIDLWQIYKFYTRYMGQSIRKRLLGLWNTSKSEAVKKTENLGGSIEVATKIYNDMSEFNLMWVLYWSVAAVAKTFTNWTFELGT